MILYRHVLKIALLAYLVCAATYHPNTDTLAYVVAIFAFWGSLAVALVRVAINNQKEDQ